jgi:branched-subunit amino acid aminotransferase/4-amino-4-deoxychorismate lyase
MARLAASAARLALPSFCGAQLLACLKALLRVEAAWVPSSSAATAAGFSLYIRPTLMATTPFLGVGPPSDASLFVVLSPCGPYLSQKAGASGSGGSAAAEIRLFLDESLVRAAPGGVGAFKVGGNYAPTVAPARAAAAAHAAAQVLFTAPDASSPDGARCVAEAGAMNVFFLLRPPAGGAPDTPSELVTPPLDGTILPGVTRQSVLDLCRAWASAQGGSAGLRVRERPLRVAELAAAAAEGRLAECFATGTAAVVLPVAALVRADGAELRCAPRRGAQPLSARVASALADIQYGRTPHAWSVRIDT